MEVGPGYRIYFAEQGSTVVLLLCGGDKSTQSEHIATAQGFWAHWKEENDGKIEQQR